MKNKYVAMIPARLGSQRIPKKNLRYLGSKPLIQYPIDLAKNSNAFTSIWVNTESELLGKFAEQQGVNFHKRPEELSSNTATNREFTYEFLQKHDCDYVIMINPTSPILKQETLDRFIQFIEENDYDTVMSVVSEKTEAFYLGNPVNFDVSEKINSQFLDPVSRIVWALTAWKKDNFIAQQNNGKNPIFSGNLGIFEIPKDESCDLDTPEDWNIAEGFIRAREIEETPKYLEL